MDITVCEIHAPTNLAPGQLQIERIEIIAKEYNENELKANLILSLGNVFLRHEVSR